MSLDEAAAAPAESVRALRYEASHRADLPESAPLVMRAQDLRHWRGRTEKPETSPRRIAARRALLFALSAGLAALAGAATLQVFRHDGLAAFEIVSLILFAPLAFGLAFWFCNAAIGLALLARDVDDPLGLTGAPAPLRTRCALLAPIYNEDCATVFARFAAMARALERENAEAAFDLFILSDTGNPAIANAERRAFETLRAQTRVNVYYRRRLQNTDNKAGNVADWVRRFGAAYETMIVLDADSLMSAEVMRRLVSAMERHRGVGLIQTMPTIVQARTLLGRYLQFGANLFSPAAWSGLAWWTGAEGSYWGHNAIVRVRAFAAHAGLPHLDGPRPFGGSVLSHDVVEAALIRRGGWAVHMAPPLAGSFEEAPPTLAEFVKRDRRWCQGNLQHVSIIAAPGLHWISRFQLAVGIVGYLTAPIFVAFLLIGLAAAAAAAIASGYG
ncbi:MAG: glucans biosynthesis glucosyltransferase MdoH, partial [Hyphomonadaceae bacterium]